ncbi:polysaccharide pyruvyl transferase family protein [Nocardiopsis sp. MG754419]|uniref:polysaccharide pyruvyl transferase family protein n=1 Tax=Nocardiopsis sp. MG754419 TaxID=2259865 RepID=UPI001BA80B00|nr:polysaccharide pyruvyl transferase family protein [Nocardiopsis sp. MG754419]MBR8743603.1 polysaccharide pyruvyl transferase family protein [Nocardiopsis sp. MG754419]
MKRVLLRSKKDPFAIVGPGAAIESNVFGNNAGNLIFSQASHKTLQTSSTEVVANGFRADAAEAARINDEYDAFVIPLANAFRVSFIGHLNALSSLIEKLTIPVVVLGVGAQSDLDYDLDRMSRLDAPVSRFVRAVLERSASIGVRGEFTEKYLHSLGFNDVEVIGCPSMFMYGDHLDVTKGVDRLDGDSAVAVNASRSALGAGDVGGIVTANFERYPNMRYFAQETKDLELLYWGDRSEVDGARNRMPLHRTHPLFRENKVRVHLDPATWIDDLRDFDFSFGTRIHGNITALLAGTPAVVLCHDSRTLELCRYFDIPHRRIRHLSSDTDAADLYAEADFTAMHEGHAERFARFTGFLEKNGLEHVHSAGEDGGAAFEERVRTTAYPPGVDAWTSAEEGVSARIGWLRRDHAEAVTKVAELGKSVRTLEKTAARVDRLEKRLKSLEKAAAQTPYRRFRRSVGRVLRTLGLRR